MHWPRRVDAHELEQYGVSGRLSPSVHITLTEQGTNFIPERIWGESEVDEAWPGDLGLPHERRLQGSHKVLSYLPRVPSQYPGIGEGNIGCEVAVSGVVRPLRVDSLQLAPVGPVDGLPHGPSQTLLKAQYSPPRSSSRSRRFSS